MVSTTYAWMPSYFNRYYHLAPDQAGIKTGLVVLMGGVGAIVWSVVADRLSTRFPRARLQVPAVAAVLTAAFAEQAHHIAVGAETLALRLARQCDNAQAVAGFLEAHPKVRRVYYPGLASHPQHALAGELFRGYGALLSFELDESIDVFAVLNRLGVVVLSSNLGDNRTLAIPVAHTIFWEMGAARRAEMGIAESLIRVSVGIEDRADLLGDFAHALG